MNPADFKGLAERVAAAEDEWLDRRVPLESVRRDFLLETQRVAPRLATRWLALTGVLLVCLAGLVASRVLQRPDPLSVRVRRQPAAVDAWVRSESNERVPIEFSDGSQVTLEPGSRLRIAELRVDGASLAVESGSLNVSVVHHKKTNFRLSFGPFAVHVTGTKFSVQWRPEQDVLRLDLREGSVVVSGCALGEPRPLRAGEILAASCRDGRFEISRGQPSSSASELPQAAIVDKALPEALTSPAERRTSQAARPPRTGTSADAERAWQAAARSGEFGKALAAVEASGFEGACERGSSADLALLADVARFGGNPQRALQALFALRRRFPGSPRAGAAAFSIARIHFDQRSAYDEAARWFGTYLKEQPSGALAREAQGRLMEALQRAGDREGARRTAEQYLLRHPTGPHARLARSLANQ